VRFVKINTEENQMLASQYQIRSIPTIMLFSKGEKLDIVSGALAKGQFDNWLDSALNRG
jgi:thioredoxin 2